VDALNAFPTHTHSFTLICALILCLAFSLALQGYSIHTSVTETVTTRVVKPGEEEEDAEEDA